MCIQGLLRSLFIIHYFEPCWVSPCLTLLALWRNWGDLNQGAVLSSFLWTDIDLWLPCRLERTLTHISLRTKELFRLLFLSPRQMSPEVSSIIAQIQENLRQHLLDYRDYLVIKSQRNLAITTYPFWKIQWERKYRRSDSYSSFSSPSSWAIMNFSSHIIVRFIPWIWWQIMSRAWNILS